LLELIFQTSEPLTSVSCYEGVKGCLDSSSKPESLITLSSLKVMSINHSTNVASGISTFQALNMMQTFSFFQIFPFLIYL